MLIVMKDRNIHPFLQPRLDRETFGRLDILKVDAAEGRLHQRDGFDEFFRVSGVEFDVEHVDIGEFLEEDRLALHHRLGRERADRAQAKDGGAVGDDRDQIAARGIIERQIGIGGDLHAGGGDAGRIGQREIALVDHAFGRLDPQFPRLGKAVIVEGGAAGIIVHAMGLKGCVPQGQWWNAPRGASVHIVRQENRRRR